MACSMLPWIIATAIRQTNITFVVVPTPSDPEGSFSLEYVCAAMEPIGRALRTNPPGIPSSSPVRCFPARPNMW